MAEDELMVDSNCKYVEEIGRDYDNGICELPEEILHYIFMQLSPYEDLNSCRLVCKKFYKLIEGVKRQIYNDFTRALVASRITWKSYEFVSKVIDITRRYAHCATRHGNSMYVFGGFTQNCTSFNDLWKLNLSTRKWERIIAKGEYPMPKGCATLLTYEDNLILFGGKCTPLAHPDQQPNGLDRADIHLYDVKENKWTLIPPSASTPPSLAGHSATIQDSLMVVFGGLEDKSCTNTVRALELNSMLWHYPTISGPKPPARYNHSQVVLDNKHLIIIGGCISPSFKILQDMWLLRMGTEAWTWTKIDAGTNNILDSVWCHPVCKMGPYIVGFTGNMQIMKPTKYSSWFPWKNDGYDERTNEISDERRLSMQLRRLIPRIEDGITYRETFPVLNMYAIDTCDLLKKKSLPLKWYYSTTACRASTPADTILYSIVPGNAEIILFGGIQKHTVHGTRTLAQQVNLLHFVKAQPKIV